MLQGVVLKNLPYRFWHWTPRYIYDRLHLFWFELHNPESPWITKQARDILDLWFCNKDVGFEWGSGRSTLWFAARVKHLTSVEEDQPWFIKIKKQIEIKKLKNISYLYKSDISLNENSSYVHEIDDKKGGSLNFILVDGALRDLCVLAAIPKLKPGGLLILDNVNWYLPCDSRSPNSIRSLQELKSKYWAHFIEQIKYWRCFWTTNGVTDTAIWVKPRNI